MRRVRGESVIPEPLLRRLIAAGQADVLVGMLTLDQAAGAEKVARAAVDAFGTAFTRERCVILAVDGGSRDGTPEAIRSAASRAAGLRTVHCIVSPPAGLPGRAGGLRLILTASELLRARAVCLLDPSGGIIETADVVRLIDPVLRDGMDMARPLFPRLPWDAPLLTQLLTPLLAAATGLRLAEPAEPEVCASPALVAALLPTVPWNRAEGGTEVWLSGVALTGDFRLTQVAMARAPSRPPRAALPVLFPQVMGAALEILGVDRSWRAARGVREVATRGELPRDASQRPLFDVGGMQDDFARGVRELEPLLAGFLSPEQLAALQAGRLDDATWASLVWTFVEASSRRTMGPGQLALALLPLYEGRAAAFLSGAGQMDASALEEKLSALLQAFVSTKPEVIHGS